MVHPHPEVTLLLALVLACTGAAPSDDTGTAGTAGDGGTAPERATIEVSGQATVDLDSYQGSETTRAVDEQGTVLCAITVELASTAARDDCADCLWAYDLASLDATVDVGDRCGDVGLDADTLAAQARAYGFAEEYFGHSNALMAELDGVWQGVAYVAWDEASGALSYSWEQERVDLP